MGYVEVLWYSLVYLLCGVLFGLVYLLNYRPKKPVLLGLTILGWPLVLVIDVVLTISRGFGSLAVYIQERHFEDKSGSSR